MIMIMIMITILINMIRIIIHFKNNSHKHLYIQVDLNLFPCSQMLLKHMQKARYLQCAWRTKTHKKRYIRGSRNYRRRTPTWHWYQSSSISLNSAIRRTPLNHYLPTIDSYLGKLDMSRIQLWKFNLKFDLHGRDLGSVSKQLERKLCFTQKQVTSYNYIKSYIVMTGIPLNFCLAKKFVKKYFLLMSFMN